MLIETRGLRRVYQRGAVPVVALAGLDLDIARGEHVAVMGPSGCGKSTLMYLLGCLDRPTAGSYRLAGAHVSELSADELARTRNQRIGFVFQSHHLLARATALANVELPLIYAEVPAAERRERALGALAAVGLSERAEHLPSELSGGQSQRVAIARAIVTKPEILLADEPTGALDSRTGGEVLDLLDTLHRDGLTIITVTHDLGVARRAGRALSFLDGRLVDDQRMAA